MAQTAKMALAWVAIFAALFVLFSFRSEMSAVWKRVKADIAGTANQDVVGTAVQIKRGDDGHFNALVKVNGKDVSFLIDSGATTTALSAETAKEAGVEPDAGFPTIIETANGRVTAARATIKAMELGTIKYSDHHAVVSESFGETNVLGMNFLDALSSWSVQGDVMTLNP